MHDSFSSLTQLISAELSQPVPSEVLALAAEIRRRHEAAVAAILFYGSCLRTQQIDGEVLDFYVLVDSYRTAYSSRALRWLNAALPPNVFYLELPDGEKTLRAKYAVISTADFQHAATLRSVHAIVWGRVCQPFVLVHARDDTARAFVADCAAQAAVTFVSRIVALLPASGDTQRFQCEDLWQRGFQETYSTELRPESLERIRQLYRADPGRYDRVAFEVLGELERRGTLRARSDERWLFVAMPARQRWWAWLGWKARRPLAKALYAARLLKSAATFRDWLPYVLWKLARHTGKQIELTERQRKRPLLWGWPVIFKLLLQRDLH